MVARPAAPIIAPARQFSFTSSYTYRPNSGFIPYVGYYLPNAASASRISRFFPDFIGTPRETVPPAPAEAFPTGRYVFSTPAVSTPQEGYSASALNLDTVVEPDFSARVTVRLPSGAELWFDGVKVPSAGPVRAFHSPALQSGRLYDYDVKARWEEDGRAVSQTQRVSVAAGSDVQVQFGSRSEARAEKQK
jgi:uncharacterized protein (TIGR03000 family)